MTILPNQPPNYDINFDTFGQDTLKAERQRYLNQTLNQMYRESMGDLNISVRAHNAIVREVQTECFAKAAELVMDEGIPKSGRGLEALCKKLTDLSNIAPKKAKL